MSNDYPYQDTFEIDLQNKGLAKVTINEYTKILSDMFDYLSDFNKGYQKNHKVSNLFNRDIEEYLQMLLDERKINHNTYNKVLSHINVYFNYLFTHQLNSNLPTIDIKGLKHESKSELDTSWLDTINVILADANVHFYARMTVLLISKGFKSEEFLQPGFYRLFNQITFSDEEKFFINLFDKFIQPIQLKQNSQDIFLKQRLAEDPHITSAGLHKYLTPSEQYLGFSLSPSKLFTGYVIDFIKKNPDLCDSKLSSQLNLDLSSINYYKGLIKKD
ncbi:hypothetical protein AKUH4B507X_08310 [Apilactobacillus kunkeei]|nr:hypothetical protein AKUH3B102A_07880 [Apilactobacillus kunkeei]CAI2602631.1 hypothetical protein AKUH3B203J_07870 [Apilactobacillus kunkeei]CAI2604363.1 hypothetical protein AKUH3B109M_07870 [Apilactobacillus kunkeei]CAI2604417.1 hypothetical protein AKUH3B204J_07890 [Apilactobacillus kunkeei]CAI2604451.1 hypothetical protein AKUH3B205J_07880 [Apilactobacillus kunkeei]